MSKKRRTRKEKIRTQIRSFNNPSDNTPVVYSIDSISPAKEKTERVRPITHSESYTYVINDARQTFLITSLIFAASIILYFLIQSQVINLVSLGY